MCNQKVSKVVLVIVNILFILLGLGLLIPGILVVLNEDVINDDVLPALKSVSFGVTNLGDMAKGLSITLIVLGSFVLVLSLIGAIGACCKIRCLLIIYIIIVLILSIGKFVIVILWIIFNSDIESKLKTEMKTALLKFTTDDLTTHELSSGWNYLNMNLECCGIDAVTGKGTGNDYTNSAWYTGSGADELPISCCPSATSSSYSSTCSFTKNADPTGQHSKGCYDAVKDFATKYSVAFICIGVFILLTEIAAVIFACSLCKKSKTGSLV
ncbi:tetraspanin-9-like isoform X3 [Mytilus californianus]|uniref:tetraspanin-9-like isoform X3 n=1 Tax=Mytilus californianus TaxID=6549 RepID=UPI0022471E49|nr:tetraspanin-9-like isoform X3 [Mytilus californianus]XP_052060170.1 tetraspanin-9-like isoform X3 [Mytilus californianus]